jgi:hypothetical protein
MKHSIRYEYSIRKQTEYWPYKNHFEFESNPAPTFYPSSGEAKEERGRGPSTRDQRCLYDTKFKFDPVDGGWWMMDACQKPKLT